MVANFFGWAVWSPLEVGWSWHMWHRRCLLSLLSLALQSCPAILPCGLALRSGAAGGVGGLGGLDGLGGVAVWVCGGLGVQAVWRFFGLGLALLRSWRSGGAV